MEREMKRGRLLIAAATAALAWAGVAGSVEDADIARCTAHADGVKRLECYDALAGAAKKKIDDALAKRLAGETPTGVWLRNIEKSPVDDSTSVFLEVRAKEEVSTRFNRRHRPALTLRCVENRTSLIINFDGAFMADIGSFGDVTVRLDDDKAKVHRMTESTYHNALGLWSGAASIPVIKSMFGKETMLVRAVPYNESPVVFEFAISGLEDAIDPLRKACGW